MKYSVYKKTIERLGACYDNKGSSFENITNDEVGAVMNKLNHRPRKTLKFKSPHAVFFADLLQDAA